MALDGCDSNGMNCDRLQSAFGAAKCLRSRRVLNEVIAWQAIFVADQENRLIHVKQKINNIGQIVGVVVVAIGPVSYGSIENNADLGIILVQPLENRATHSEPPFVPFPIPAVTCPKLWLRER
jgi:hypothetical protein